MQTKTGSSFFAYYYQPILSNATASNFTYNLPNDGQNHINQIGKVKLKRGGKYKVKYYVSTNSEGADCYIKNATNNTTLATISFTKGYYIDNKGSCVGVLDIDVAPDTELTVSYSSTWKGDHDTVGVWLDITEV